MIKKLSLKFVLVFLVLVVSVFITSSCYAEDTTKYNDIGPLSSDGVKELTVTNTSTSKFYNGTSYSSTVSSWTNSYLNYVSNGTAKMLYFKYNGYSFCYLTHSHNSSFTNPGVGYMYKLTTYYLGFSTYGCSGQLFVWNSDTQNWHYTNGDPTVADTTATSSYFDSINFNSVVLDIYCANSTEDYIRYNSTSKSGVIIFDSSEYVYVPDTSFDYSFEGVKRGQIKLSITNLNSSFRMYGYVGLESCSDGEILDTTANIENLRLLATKMDNSDLYCYLSDGEELIYYIVDENNVILDVGYISEMAKGNFLYGFKVNDGVDFVFLKDGQVYWDNNLTFKYKNGNSNTIQNNDIVSMGQYSYIETNKTVASGTYTGYVYDVNGSLLSEAKCNYSNDLSSLSIKVDTTYYEVDTLLKNYSCYWLQTIYLSGYNKDGTSIDFSNYYINWSVPSWVDFDKIELGTEGYNKRSGTLRGFTSTGVLSMFNLKLYEYLNVHTRSFDITLQVYDGNGNLVLTHVINSDNIVDNQIKSEENNVDKGDYDILDNPGYTGGSNSNYGDIGNIQNWTADDYINLMSTDNFVWEFFKAILGNLPWWITTPLTILIFGVVIITIIRFARGA